MAEGRRPRRVRCDGGHARARPARRRAPRARPLDRGPRATSRPSVRAEQLSLGAAPAPAADDHLDRRPARDHRASSLYLNRERARRAVPDSILPGRTRCSCSPRSSSSTSASRCAASAGRSSCEDRLRHQACATRPRSSSCRGSSTASCRPSSATSTAPTCSRSTARRRSSRTFGTVFIERILDLFAIAILGLAAGFWSFRERPAAGDPGRLRVGVVVVVVARRSACSRCATSGGGSSSALPLPHRVLELYDRFEEGVFGADRARARCPSSSS